MSFGRRDGEDAENDELDGAGGLGWLKRATLAVVFIVILAVAGAGWFAYDQGLVQVTDGEIPFIEAGEGDTKVRPDDPGGLQIPYQDKLVFERLAPNQSEPLVERLLPPPEIPIERPSVPDIPALASVAPPASTGSPAPPARGAESTASTDNSDLEEIAIRPTEPEPAKVTDTTQVAEPEQLLAPEQPRLAEVSAGTPAETLAPPRSAPSARRDDQIARVIENLTADEQAPESPPESQASLRPSPKPDTPAPKAGWRVQVASLGDPTAAESEWVRLKARHADVLANLSLNLQRADLDRGTFYRIQAGPFPDRGSAEKVCDRLKSRSQGCLVVSP